MNPPESFTKAIQDAFCALSHNPPALRFAKPFGVPQIGDKDTHTLLRAETKINQTVNDCLYGRRPDLSLKIWKNVVAVIKYKNDDLIRSGYTGYYITDLNRTLIAHKGLDLGTIILLRLIMNISNPVRNQAINIGNFLEGAKTVIDIIHTGSKLHFEVIYNDFTHDIFWTNNALHIVGLPDTLVAKYTGGKLSELISHPAFDQFDFTIHNIDTASNSTVRSVRTSYQPEDAPSQNIVDIAHAEIDKIKAAAKVRI